MPLRRSTDKFKPKPVPKSVSEYRELTWHLLQYVDYKTNLINGTVADHDKKIIDIDKDVSVARKLGWIALSLVALVGGVGGIIALF